MIDAETAAAKQSAAFRPIGMKVDNEEVWQSIKQGDVKGFSLEGFFTELSDEYLAEQEIEKIMRELTTELNS